MTSETSRQQSQTAAEQESVRSATGNSRSHSRAATALLIAVAAGVVAGLLIPPNGVRSVAERWLLSDSRQVADDSTSGSDAEQDAHGGTFEVSIAAQKTYGLVVGKASRGSFTQHIDVPAFIRERPTVSNLQASSRMQGIVRRIFVQVGQSVRDGDPLIELELTGDELASAQSVLLDSVQQLQILDDEIARLEVAAEEGGIVLRSVIQKQYEQRRMKSVIEAKRQELLIRGLSVDDVSGIIKDKKLVRTVVIHVPMGIRPTNDGTTTQFHSDSNRHVRLVSEENAPATGEWVYSIEAMNVSPGTVVNTGDAVCDLAYHETLLVEGQAYERDLPLLTHLINQRRAVTVQLGDSDTPELIHDLQILFMDNHVDNKTQTYRFYVEVPNTVLTENITAAGPRFRTWRFKPGQRGLVRLPQKEWSDRLVLPAEAVAEDGVDHVIFQQVAVHDHFHGDAPPHSEFRKIVVKVDFKDQHNVVVDAEGQLKSRHNIATNNADMLTRAMNDGEGGGGHAHHGHEH
ncbi:MAG: HlyD family efflux transporter periplasmic adaptor subunit [Fuerstiella sp.]|jgi:multidrug efflux pump subunit AcrA (membrane-fusion protein)|nr:HlyD family efflux transporter periplasmic adaptor subunit [Fuerstiella sp.]MDG2127404.1 HlyD family efflux transporter periplasmic adaptor subunit [Fuerstiella sp.]